MAQMRSGTLISPVFVECRSPHASLNQRNFIRLNGNFGITLTDILWKRNVLPTVRTLILDGQFIHLDIVRDILLDNECQIRLLSLRNTAGYDHVDFKDLIDGIFRGGPIPDGPARLEGIYYFGPPRVSKKFSALLVEENGAAAEEDETGTANPWYLRSTVATQEFHLSFSSILRATAGNITWDAVLCRAPRHTHPNPRFVIPTIASVALGPAGCHICHTSPEGPGSTVHRLPLLYPPPFQSSSIKVAQKVPTDGAPIASLPFYARCRICLKHRWCEICNKWWCENCYQFGAPNCYKENDFKGTFDDLVSKFPDLDCLLLSHTA